MKFSPLALGLMVLGVSSFAAQGCADVDLSEFQISDCEMDENGALRCSVQSDRDEDPGYDEHVRALVEPSGYLDDEYVNDLDSDFYAAFDGAWLPPSDHDVDTFSATPLFQHPEAEGPCPETKFDEAGDELCLDDIVIIELSTDRAVYECVYDEC